MSLLRKALPTLPSGLAFLLWKTESLSKFCHQFPFSSYKNAESSWENLQPAWEFPLGGEAALFCLPLHSSPSFLFFSGPDLDKLAASFLQALWRTEHYTLESLKPCHFHLEPAADLARQPGK